jgi:M6 family metalloprotease-like protein
MEFDGSFFYRLTNRLLGPGQSLDVLPDGSGRLGMAPSADNGGQKWRLIKRGTGKYGLQTSYLGDCFSLDIINDDTDRTPWLAHSGDHSGQYWTLTSWGDGTYRLANDFTGPQRLLSVDRATHQPVLEAGDHSGQHWTLTRLGKIPSTVPIPDLNPRGDVNQTEGPADYTLFARPKGRVKAVMVFVDFQDAPGRSNPTSPAKTAEHLLGLGQAQRLFRDQSYGQLSLDVTVRSDLGWRRLPKPSTKYNFRPAASHRSYISDAARLFRASEIKFSDYKFVFIVAPKAAKFPDSPAFNQWPDGGAKSPSGEIRLAVTFGADSYDNRYINLVHEVGHLLGLPDLYTYGPGHNADDSKAGGWDIMSDIFRSVSFLGWHRYKNGWLAASRTTYLAQNTRHRSLTLNPLSGACGLALIVLPIDDVHHPSKVFVIELAQPVLGRNDVFWGEGVLTTRSTRQSRVDRLLWS